MPPSIYGSAVFLDCKATTLMYFLTILRVSNRYSAPHLQLIFELSVGNLVQVVWPWVYLKYKQRGALHSGYGDEHLKSEFDLTEEFTEVLYRQFIIYLGTTVFPLIPVMGVVSYIVEYWIDKYRLIYLCRKQLNKPSPVRARLLFGLHIFVAVAALFSFPNGTVWLFAGFDIQGKCLFWGDVN
eukprot:gb/GECG01001762.1/.p1 GENE.gb/GECG01001762.1/~~gb/GECG01001762.1/.p1  ORF type:complete len:183 (+),score=10.11 gb/GECG01001762.1/:1-549(+)